MHARTIINRRHWIACTALAAYGSVAHAAEAQRKPWPKQRATPAVQLPALDGSVWNLESVRGKPVLLNFWASWCEPCRAEMPTLQQLAAEHQARGLQVMAVNFKEGEPAVRRFIAATGLDLPVLYDRDGAAAKAFGVGIFPSTLAIDRQGKVLFSVVGEFDWTSAEARRWLAAIL